MAGLLPTVATTGGTFLLTATVVVVDPIVDPTDEVDAEVNDALRERSGRGVNEQQIGQ